jgi:membrane protein implicated in regulation of membrane protease activity
MKRRESNDIKRAYAMWAIAGTSLIVAAVAGSAIFAVFTGTADAGTLAWGIIGIASLLEALVLLGYGLRLRQRYVNKVQTYETRGDYRADDGSNRPRVPLLGDGQANQRTTFDSL